MAAALAEARAVSSRLEPAQLEPAFWQALLALECSPQKSRTLAWEFGSSQLDPLAFLSGHALVTQTERKRLDSLSTSALDNAMRAGVRVVTEAEYPPHAREAKGIPPALFAWGSWEAALAQTVAIVGTRGASNYGKAVAMKFAEAFAAAGATIVSGGALGIDAAAHKGALAAGGKTIAVLAGSVDNVFPAVHRGLFQQIRDSGCIVSQFPVGSPLAAYRFLVRNHVIAALSQAVVAIEVPERSGALSTVNAANEIGRQVFVVPANVGNLNFRGSHELIRDGATLIDHPHQAFEALGLSADAPQASQLPTNPIAAKLAEVLGAEPLSTEQIVRLCGLDAATVMTELTMMEMNGVVARARDGYMIRP